MRDPRNDNRRYLLRIWIPTLVFCAVVGGLAIAALTSGDPGRVSSILFALVFTAVLLVSTRWFQKRRLARALQSADPGVALRPYTASLHRIPNGTLFAASVSATLYALYGRFQEAEDAFDSVSWQDVPPFLQAQDHVARATIAYARGSLSDGLDHAISAAQLASLDSRFPGAQRAELGLRTLRNLGLALTGRATQSTAEELRTAFERLPLLGQINAAWGLAVIAARKGDTPQQQNMRELIATRAPHFAPVLRSIDSVGEDQVT